MCQTDATKNTYWDFVIDHLFMLVPAQMYVMKEMESFRDFPPRQKPPSFDFEQVLAMLQSAAGEGMH